MAVNIVGTSTHQIRGRTKVVVARVGAKSQAWWVQ